MRMELRLFVFFSMFYMLLALALGSRLSTLPNRCMRSLSLISLECTLVAVYMKVVE